jgi:hypothetical protein
LFGSFDANSTSDVAREPVAANAGKDLEHLLLQAQASHNSPAAIAPKEDSWPFSADRFWLRDRSPCVVLPAIALRWVSLR